jgi:Fe-S-cluster formation regulator IscX/YfhJ
MHHLKFNDAEQIAASIQTAHAAIDDAMINFVQLTGNMLAAASNSDMPASASQKAIEAATMAITNMCNARRDFVTAHRQMTALKGQSDLKEVGFGCLGDGPITKGSASLRIAA